MKNVTLGPSNIFDFLNIRPFSPGGLWTFLVALAHGVALEFFKISNQKKHMVSFIVRLVALKTIMTTVNFLYPND